METHLQVLAFIIFHGDKTGTTEGWEGTSWMTIGVERRRGCPLAVGGRGDVWGRRGSKVCQSGIAFYRRAAGLKLLTWELLTPVLRLLSFLEIPVSPTSQEVAFSGVPAAFT